MSITNTEDRYKDSLLTYKQEIGLETERTVSQILDYYGILFDSNPLSNPIDWLMNDAKKEGKRRVDFKVFHKGKIFLLEVKYNQYKICPCHFWSDVLPRFTKSDSKHNNEWILVVTNKGLIHLRTLELCRQYRISVYDVYELAILFKGTRTTLYSVNSHVNSVLYNCFDSLECSNYCSLYPLDGYNTKPTKKRRLKTRLRHALKSNRLTKYLVKTINPLVKTLIAIRNIITSTFMPVNILENRTLFSPLIISNETPNSRDILKQTEGISKRRNREQTNILRVSCYSLLSKERKEKGLGHFERTLGQLMSKPKKLFFNNVNSILRTDNPQRKSLNPNSSKQSSIDSFVMSSFNCNLKVSPFFVKYCIQDFIIKRRLLLNPWNLFNFLYPIFNFPIHIHPSTIKLDIQDNKVYYPKHLKDREENYYTEIRRGKENGRREKEKEKEGEYA
ncbi:MAG: hypothetical protein QXD45_06225 [Candidatus Bathyarchaeia archaeon]